MDPAVQAFKDKMAEKAAAKQKVMEALGRARLNDDPKDWAIVEKEGVNGTEGAAMAEMQKMADAYVKANPDQFVNVAGYVSPEGQDNIIQLISVFSQAGMEEEVLKLTMFELAKFERQEIGVQTRAKVRVGNGD